jgi:ferric iron reductase protein FhuF
VLMIDYTLLEQHGNITTMAPPEAVLSKPAVDLTNPSVARLFLETYGEIIQAEDLNAAATFFANWIRGLTMAQQYLVSLCSNQLDLSLENLTVHLLIRNGYANIAFQLKDTTEYTSYDDKHEVFRNRTLERFYSTTITPLLECMAEVGKAPLGQLWGQLPLTLWSFTQKMHSMTTDDSDQRHIDEDYYYISKEMQPEIFKRKRNPFDVKFREIDNPYNPSEPYWMRPACCQAYRIGGCVYCYVCPKLTREQRELKKAEIVAASH